MAKIIKNILFICIEIFCVIVFPLLLTAGMHLLDRIAWCIFIGTFMACCVSFFYLCYKKWLKEENDKKLYM